MPQLRSWAGFLRAGQRFRCRYRATILKSIRRTPLSVRGVSMSQKDPYKILGVSRSASQDEIRKLQEKKLKRIDLMPREITEALQVKIEGTMLGWASRKRPQDLSAYDYVLRSRKVRSKPSEEAQPMEPTM